MNTFFPDNAWGNKPWCDRSTRSWTRQACAKLLFLLLATHLTWSAGAANNVAIAQAVDATNLTWSTGGAFAWGVDTTVTHDGVDAAGHQVSSLGASWIEATTKQPGTVSFWWKVNTPGVIGGGNHYLYFSVDNAYQDQISDTVDWQQRTVTVGPGSHKLVWTHQNNDSDLGGLGAWVDQVVFSPFINITAQPTNQFLAAGSSGSFRVTATTTNPPLTYQWQLQGVSLAGATNSTLVIPNVQLTNAGAYRVVMMDARGAASTTASDEAFLSLSDALAPSVATLAATDVQFRNALLAGTVNPNGGLTTAFFEYGLTTNYDSATLVTNLGSAPTESVVRLTTTNLVKNTTYYFRIVAYHGGGTNFGASHSFTTRNPAGPVAVLGAPIYAGSNEDVRAKLLATGFFDQVDTFMIAPGFPVPTLAALTNYAAVMIYVGGSSYNNGVALGNLLGDYFEQGGGVVIAAQGFENMGGKFLTSGYMPFTPGFFSSGNFLSLVKVLPDHPLLEGVNSFNGGSSSYQNGGIVTSNATLVANWSSGTPLMAAKELGVGRVAGLNFMPVSVAVSFGFWQTNTDGARLLANALLWVQRSHPTLLQQPTNQYVTAGATALFAVSATTTNSPLRYQWRFNGTNIVGATNDTLTIANAQLTNQGPYTVFIQDQSGGVLSTPATLVIVSPYITAPPTNVNARLGSNVTFSVLAGGAAPLFYQWQLNGVSLAAATNATLILTNLQLPQFGDYTAVVSNAFGSVTSSVATLILLQIPVITQTPSPVTTVAGENVTFTVVVTNTATLPITYRWIRAGSAFATNVLNSRTCSITIYNVRTNGTATNSPGSFRVGCTNAAGTVNSSTFALTVLPAVAPSAITLPATNVTAAAATLTSLVNPNGGTTWGSFEFGTDLSYGSSTPAVSMGSGTNSLSLSTVVSGLLPGATYHFRVVAGNSGGTNFGSDQTFVTTSPGLPPALFSLEKQGGLFSLSVVTVNGAIYYLERTTSLSDSNWTAVANVPGNGLVQSLSDLSATNAHSFYRVRVE